MSYIFRVLIKLVKFPYNKLMFREFNLSSRIVHPILLSKECICIKKDVFIRNNARIEGVKTWNKYCYQPEIIFEEGVSVEQGLHLTCAGRVVVGKRTSIAANVTITDINHQYEDINRPIDCQDIDVSSVEIGEDCKIYNNAVILPGTKLGRHVVVGANSVVSGS